MTDVEVDAVDGILEQWRSVRPEVDTTPIAVIGRLSRLSRLVDRRLAANFARHGIENWMYDVLATLRRSGEPYQLTAGELMSRTMVTTGAMTNRVDRLERLGLVRRATGSDRRQVLVRLTKDGLHVVDEVLMTHLATEQEILAPVSPAEQRELAEKLRVLLLALGDITRT